MHDIYSPHYSSQESGSDMSSSSASSSRSSNSVGKLMNSELYDSENKSDLSSIHKDIAQMDSPADFKPETRESLRDLGGCQVEEMRDDTVVGKCGRMF